MAYSFGVPGTVVWSSHILIGILLAYIGYLIVEKKHIDKYLGILLIVLGVLAAIYHLHIWYTSSSKTSS